MAAGCRALILERIRERGPMTVAEYMDLALYHPEHGYYARASRRTGRAGDFITSVVVGPLFGELLAVQIAEMWRILGGNDGPGAGSQHGSRFAVRGSQGMAEPTRDAPDSLEAENEAPSTLGFDLVEAGAGNGQLARDILDAMRTHEAACHAAIRLHLVEPSAEARRAQRGVLGPHAHKLASSCGEMPVRVDGVIVANELLDALPTHLVEMTPGGLREVHVDAEGGRLVERLSEVSSPHLPAYLEQAGVALEPGWRGEVNLSAVAWVQDAARRLDRGFLILIDYGYRAPDLYSAARAAGTLTSYRRHTSEGLSPAAGQVPTWLADPGGQDITAHVDLTSIVSSAEREGLATLAVLDQTYFLLGLALAGPLDAARGEGRRDLAGRLALKTLAMPGGLGSTHKVMIFGKGVGTPVLQGCSFGTRVT